MSPVELKRAWIRNRSQSNFQLPSISINLRPLFKFKLLGFKQMPYKANTASWSTENRFCGANERMLRKATIHWITTWLGLLDPTDLLPRQTNCSWNDREAENNHSKQQQQEEEHGECFEGPNFMPWFVMIVALLKSLASKLMSDQSPWASMLTMRPLGTGLPSRQA